VKIEKEEILFHETNFPRRGLSELQLNYLQVLTQQKTIEKTFLFYLSQGWLVNFNEFFDLVQFLLKHKAIRNLNFYHIFNSQNQLDKGFFEKLFEPAQAESAMPFRLEEQAFFRSLTPQVIALLKKNAKVITVPQHSLITREGGTSREMYFVLEGKLGIFKNRANHKVRVADLEPGCVFGEASFLWQSARTADVVSLVPTKLIRFEYNEHDFAELIRKDIAVQSQVRFWALHAMMKSDLLRDLPSDNIDELLSLGKSIPLASGSVLFAEASIGTSFFVVVQGEIQITQRGRVINQLRQGDLLGEVSLFATGGKRTASVQAIQDSVLIEILKDDFYRLLSRNLFLAREIESLAWKRIQNDQKRAQKEAS